MNPPGAYAKLRRMCEWRAVRISGTLYYIVFNTRSLTGLHAPFARMLNSARKNIVTACVAIATFTFAAMLPAAPQQKTAKKPSKPPVAAAPAAPFRNSESLSYSGAWLGLSDVLAIQLNANDDRPFNAHPEWHFQARLQTKNPLHYILAVDDHFDSYSAQADFAGEQFEMHLNEGSKVENHILRIAPSQTPLPAGTTQVQLLHGTRDALGFLYYLRTANWQQTTEVRSPVFDGRKVYDVRATVMTPRSDLAVAAGKFTATGLSIRPFLNGKELADTKITLWIAQDAAHTPVLIEVVLPFGSGRVELTQAVPGK
jgi:hypothetical protein|nr:DUF3108 domain-containing protein [Candidatus Acidoferrales bacterium]